MFEDNRDFISLLLNEEKGTFRKILKETRKMKYRRRRNHKIRKYKFVNPYFIFQKRFIRNNQDYVHILVYSFINPANLLSEIIKTPKLINDIKKANNKDNKVKTMITFIDFYSVVELDHLTESYGNLKLNQDGFLSLRVQNNEILSDNEFNMYDSNDLIIHIIKNDNKEFSKYEKVNAPLDGFIEFTVEFIIEIIGAILENL